jgi:hypothetical protein
LSVNELKKAPRNGFVLCRTVAVREREGESERLRERERERERE